MDHSQKSKTCKYCKQSRAIAKGTDCCYQCWQQHERGAEKPMQKCPECGSETRIFVMWDYKKMCVPCRDKAHNPQKAKLDAERKANREEADRVMSAERDSKKAEAMKPREDRIELVQHVDTVEIKDGRDVHAQQFMTKVTAIRAASVKPKPMNWLWLNRVPAGAITWGVGKPGNAKSLWATDLVARVSSGADFPDGAKNTMGAKKVLMYCGEDDLHRTVVPRLMASNANLENITLLDNSSFDVFDREYNRIDRRSIDLSQDCKTLSHLIHDNPDIALLILDPTTGVYGSRNTNHDKDMRPIMNELRDMCEKRGLTIVGITHTNKRGEAAAIDQIQGASSIAGAARAAWLFTRDSESDDEHAHVMTCIKSNLSDNHDGLKLLTKAVKVNEEVGEHPMIVWGESTKMQADEANQALKEKRETKVNKRDAVKLAIQALLGEKPLLSNDVYTALEKQGHSSETIKRAAGELTNEKVIYRKQGGGRWYMVLAEHLFEFEQADSEASTERTIAVGVGEAL
jgi:putative DNA primase/helicase